MAAHPRVQALTVVAVDVVTAWTGWSLDRLGRIQVSPALPLAVRIGLAAVGCSRASLLRWHEYALGSAVVLPFVVGRYLHGAGGLEQSGAKKRE